MTTTTTTRAIIGPGLPPALARVVARYEALRIAPQTRRAYTAALRSYARWCKAQRLKPWPPAGDVVRGYVADLASRGRSMATINMALVAIGEAMRLAGLESIRPELRDVVAGIRRTHGTAPTRRVAPLLARDLAECLRTLPGSSAGTQRRSTAHGGVRERAFLLLGWSCGFRRSELAALELRDVVANERAWIVTVRRSKRDQEGAGVELGVACIEPHEVCAACALGAWLDVRREAVIACAHCDGAGCERCPLFGVSDRTIARAAKRAAFRLGRSPAAFSGHSLRRGFITSARLAGVPDADTMHVTRHKSARVFAGYVEHAHALAGSTPAQRALAADRKGGG